ncbi:alpha/beta hydrolase [uncultured Schumannella sp.]|uniref:alpha/beta hydrolase n=1 Tax=uncultured Schumannella sp. TaxID=1195956 RepID=UPI0025D22296|nr:alpha/beta hydrolase [uncultured Schumannella sp.]
MTSDSRTPQVRRLVRRTGVIALALGAAALVGAVVWAANPMPAEPAPLAAVAADTSLTVVDGDGVIVLEPADPTGAGLLFFPGARVAPAAYESKLSALTDAGITVVIAEVPLNFAILETRDLATFTGAAPTVDTWYLGGHSLGGVRACQYAGDNLDEVAGLILFGSYCATDLAATGLSVLSLSGENDLLSTAEKIADAAHLLPADTVFVEIPGATHAQFGDYGEQPGDGVTTTTDAAVRTAIAAAVASLLGVAS